MYHIQKEARNRIQNPSILNCWIRNGTTSRRRTLIDSLRWNDGEHSAQHILSVDMTSAESLDSIRFGHYGLCRRWRRDSIRRFSDEINLESLRVIGPYISSTVYANGQRQRRPVHRQRDSFNAFPHSLRPKKWWIFHFASVWGPDLDLVHSSTFCKLTNSKLFSPSFWRQHFGQWPFSSFEFEKDIILQTLCVTSSTQWTSIQFTASALVISTFSVTFTLNTFNIFEHDTFWHFLCFWVWSQWTEDWPQRDDLSVWMEGADGLDAQKLDLCRTLNAQTVLHSDPNHFSLSICKLLRFRTLNESDHVDRRRQIWWNQKRERESGGAVDRLRVNWRVFSWWFWCCFLSDGVGTNCRCLFTFCSKIIF